MAGSPSSSVTHRALECHYYRLADGFQEVLEKIAAKLLAVRLIDIDSLKSSTNTSQPESDRSESLVGTIMSKIGSDKKMFDQLVAVMSEIPELQYLANSLKRALKVEEERSTRAVLVIQPLSPPPLEHVTGSDVKAEARKDKDSGFCAPDRQSSFDADRVSLSDFQEELPGVLHSNEIDLVIDPPQPVTEASTQGAQSLVASSPFGLSRSGKTFSYTLCSAPPAEDFEPEAMRSQESSEKEKVNSLTRGAGYLFSQKDREIAALAKKLDHANKKIEKLTKEQHRMKEQLDELDDDKKEASEDRTLIREEISQLETKFFNTISEKKEDFLKVTEYFTRVDVKGLIRRYESGQLDGPGQCEDSKSEDTNHREDAKHNAPSHKDVLIALLPIACHWKTIGVCLGLKHPRLTSIEKETSDDQGALREMTALYVRTGLATWDQLVDAVKSVGEQVVAAEIEKKYIQQEK